MTNKRRLIKKIVYKTILAENFEKNEKFEDVLKHLLKKNRDINIKWHEPDFKIQKISVILKKKKIRN